MNFKAGVRMFLRAGLFLFAFGVMADDAVTLQLRTVRGCGNPFLPEIPRADLPFEEPPSGKLRTTVMIVESYVVKLPDGREGYITLPQRRVVDPYIWWLAERKYSSASERVIRTIIWRGTVASRKNLPLVDMRRPVK